jgi:hypothetical protein
MPRATDPKFNLLASKPDDLDRYWLFDIDADEQKVQQYGVLKSFFVKTDEATDIEAILEFQSTITKPNSILKFGSSGEFRIYSDGTDLFVKGTNAAGKLRFYANSAQMLALDPVNNSLATYGNVVNYDGTAGAGMEFSAANVATFHQATIFDAIIRANGGIDLTLNNISYTGAAGTGLEFDASNNAEFNQIVNCDSNLNVSGQINANKAGEWSLTCIGKSWFKDNIKVAAHWIGYDGGAAGMKFDASNNATFSGGIASGNITTTGNITASNRITADNDFRCQAATGVTFSGMPSSLVVKGGIITGYTP